MREPVREVTSFVTTQSMISSDSKLVLRLKEFRIRESGNDTVMLRNFTSVRLSNRFYEITSKTNVLKLGKDREEIS